MPDPSLRERVRAALIAAPPGREVDAVMEVIESAQPQGRFRVGRTLGDRTLYCDDELIGCVDPGWGQRVADALNGNALLSRVLPALPDRDDLLSILAGLADGSRPGHSACGSCADVMGRAREALLPLYDAIEAEAPDAG